MIIAIGIDSGGNHRRRHNHDAAPASGPGAIIGLLCAAGYFLWRGSTDPAMAKLFDALIPHAPILFVPAGAGVVANLDVIAGGFLAIVTVITLGTVATLLATGLAMQFLLRPKQRAEHAG
jgi:holin-like protein